MFSFIFLKSFDQDLVLYPKIKKKKCLHDREYKTQPLLKTFTPGLPPTCWAV